MTAHEVKLPSAKTFSRAKFIIQSVYPGGKDDDTRIIEIEFWNAGKNRKWIYTAEYLRQSAGRKKRRS